MPGDKLYIKNMVCNRCIMVVGDVLARAGVEPAHVGLGEVLLREKLTVPQREDIAVKLNALGFEIIDDRRSRLVQQVKSSVIELVHNDNGPVKTNLSDYIASKLRQDYNYVSHLFSEVENTTIEKYYIAQKVERVKELLVYNEMSLGQIADTMNYSSAGHLSAQFKKVTGFTPSHYKEIKENRRKPLDKV